MQPDRHKSKNDTWTTEELKKHLKTMQSDNANDRRHKERSHHREEDEQTRRKPRPDEKKDERERKYRGRDGHAEQGKGDNPEQRREKEKARGDKDKPHVSERHRTKDREKAGDKVGSAEKPAKEYGTYDLSREERKMRDSHEKSKHRSDDRERRHEERREKEGRKRESEERDDRKQRHRKESEVFMSHGADQERRRSDRKPTEASDREKRHHSRQEKGTPSDQRSPEDPGVCSDRAKEQHFTEGYIHGEKDRRHRDKKDHRTRAHERTKTDSQENMAAYKSPSKMSLAKPESNDEKEIEETIYNIDTTYDGSTNYEEDFEDYDDDFEDESEEETTVDKTLEPKVISKNAEVEEIQKAMLLENESVAAIPYRHRAHDHQDDDPSTEGRNSTPRRSSQRGTFIDFGSAKQRQVSGQISSKQKIRSLEILRLIDLDFSSTFTLLDLPPVKEYEMYIRNFGKTNTKQAYVQCNEDAVDREIQTEEIDLEEKWTQHPGEGAVVCGGHRNDVVRNIEVVTKVDTQRLTMFLRSACQVITVLLEEDRAEKQSNNKIQSEAPCLSFSESCFHLNTSLSFLQGRSVYLLQFSEAQRHLLLTTHGLRSSTESASLWEKYIICIWNIWQPSTPQKILICQSEVKCCCFSPGLASLVFAGTVEGSVLVWDLREDLSIHQTMVIEDTNWTFRSPTFSTDGVFTQASHAHPVKAVEPVPSTEMKSRGISALSSPEDISGLSFQVASIDESGHLILWVVVEIRKADLAGSQSDLGLIPGGKVKLIHSSSIHLSDKFFHKDVLMLGSPQALNIKFLPPDFNHFVIGTDIGLVTHGTRYGLVEPPMQYTSLHSKLRPAQVTAIDFSPFGAAAFLAGCSDGSIRLHVMSTEVPVVQWEDSTNGRCVTALQWSLTRPTVFFVLDAASSMYIWDLSQNDLHPIAKESILPERVLSMSVFGESEKNNNVMGLALGKSSGKVEIQYIKKKIAKSQPQELEKLHLILHEIL